MNRLILNSPLKDINIININLKIHKLNSRLNCLLSFTNNINIYYNKKFKFQYFKKRTTTQLYKFTGKIKTKCCCEIYYFKSYDKYINKIFGSNTNKNFKYHFV